MSTSEQINGADARGTSGGEVSGEHRSAATVVDSPGMGCPLEPGSVHLLMADTAVGEIHQYGIALALCGAELTADGLPPWECPQGCECPYDKLICPECVRRAAQWSADAVAERPTSGTEFGRRVPDSGTEATT
ncbi:MAG: hypothetical protein ACRDSL_12040 [Pseudonocardiaceae bacterium]